MAEKKKVPAIVAPANSDKKKALETAIAKIEKDYGKGTIMRLGDDIPVNVESLSTGSLSLDLALGIGGVPRGRIVEIYGPEASGKTTLALHIVASAQKNGGEAAYIDVEHALEPAYARALGVDIDSLLISQPDTGEQALDIAESLVRSGAIDVLVVDSVAALIPRAELEGEVGDTVVGMLARLMSQAMRRLAGAISKNNCTVIFINQLRQKIGVMYGNPETTPGGLALKYYASVRIDVRRIETLKVGGEMVGNRTRAKVVKNKVAPPFREAEFDIMYGEGISKVGEIIDLGVKLEIIDKAGAWYTCNGQRIQGRDGVREYLLANPDACDAIEKEIRENAYKLLPLHRVEPNPEQPRQDFDQEELEALADSIRTHGILQPLTVRQTSDGYYQIIAGERRWRAARMAELTEVPAIVVEADDKTATELALIENLQRQDLNSVEEALGYQTLIQDYGLTQ